MAKTVGNHVRSPIDQTLPEVLMKRWQLRPMDPRMVMVFEVKTNIEHCEAEKTSCSRRLGSGSC